MSFKSGQPPFRRPDGFLGGFRHWFCDQGGDAILQGGHVVAWRVRRGDAEPFRLMGERKQRKGYQLCVYLIACSLGGLWIIFLIQEVWQRAFILIISIFYSIVSYLLTGESRTLKWRRFWFFQNGCLCVWLDFLDRIKKRRMANMASSVILSGSIEYL